MIKPTYIFIIYCLFSCTSKQESNFVYLLDECNDFDPKHEIITSYYFRNGLVDIDLGYEAGRLKLYKDDGTSYEFQYLKFNGSGSVYFICFTKYWELNIFNEPGVSHIRHNYFGEIFQKEELEFSAKNVMSTMGFNGLNYEVKKDKWHLDRLKHIHIQNDTAHSLAENVIPDCSVYAKRIEFLIDSFANSYAEFIIPLNKSSYQKILFTKPLDNSVPIVELEFKCTCYASYKIVEPFKDMYL